MTEAVPRTILTVAVSQDGGGEAGPRGPDDRPHLRAARRGHRVDATSPASPRSTSCRRRSGGPLDDSHRGDGPVSAERAAGDAPRVRPARVDGGTERPRRLDPQEFAVVIGPSVDVDDAAVFAQWARVHKPELGVILLRETVDAHALSTALRSGMREVVESQRPRRPHHRRQPRPCRLLRHRPDDGGREPGAAQAAASAALSEAQAQAEAAREEAERPTGQMITVFSTKGGVGKSLMAANIAVSLADQGSSVCIVDLDVNNGDIAIMLQLTPMRIAQRPGRLPRRDRRRRDRDAGDALLQDAGRGRGTGAPRLTRPGHQRGHRPSSSTCSCKVYDYVVVDTSGVFDDHALTALDRTDTLVLVGTLDIPALKGLKLATQTLDLLNFPRDKWTFVLNRADSKVGLSVDEYESTLGLKADCSLVSSREVLTAVNRGEPLVRAYASHPNSKAIKAFATTIAGAARAAEAASHARRQVPCARQPIPTEEGLTWVSPTDWPPPSGPAPTRVDAPQEKTPAKATRPRPPRRRQDRARPVRGRQEGRPRAARRLPRPQALRRPHDAERAGEQRPARAPGRDRRRATW